MSRHLVAVLHSLPLTSVVRTRTRVDVVRRVLGCESASIVNLYPRAIANVNAVGLGVDDGVIVRGRADIARALDRVDTTDVLLAYGVQLPTGEARKPFRAQMDWLDLALSARSHDVWTFGGRPTHPSRWQRVVHRHAQGLSLEQAAALLLIASTEPGVIE